MGALTPDNLLISSPVDLRNAKAVNLKYLAGSIENSNEWYAEYYDLIVTTSDSLKDILQATPVFSEALPEGDRMLERTIDLSKYLDSLIYITFRHHNTVDKNFLIIDDIVVEEVYDVELVKVNFDPIALEGRIPISGTIKNLGGYPIDGFEITWDVGSGPQSQLFDNVVGGGESYDFTLDSTLLATKGNDYTIDLCVVAYPDSISTNNCIKTKVSCPTQEGSKLPLMEVFSSSACDACYDLSINGFGGVGLKSYLESANANAQSNAELAIISYQGDWSGNGDHAHNDDVQTRVNYYEVIEAPRIFIDGIEKSDPLDINLALEVPTYLDMEATATVSGNEISVDVKVIPYASYSGLLMHVAILDDQYTAGDIADGFTNGQTDFQHVLRKLVPKPTGFRFNLKGGVTYNTNKSYETQKVVSGFPTQGSFETHIGSEREIVVFLQDAKGAIVNATVAKFNTTLVNELAGRPFKVYPNPSSGETVIDLLDTKNAFFTIYTTKGQILLTGDINGSSSIDMSALDNGLYFLSLKDNEGNIAVSKIQLLR